MPKEEHQEETKPSDEARPKAYLLHRTNGTSRPYPKTEDDDDIDSKPPCGVCFVPPPVYKLSGLLEQNSLCESFGKIGCVATDNKALRRKIFMVALVANSLSFLLGLVACLSLSLNFDHIVAMGFSKGLVSIPRYDIPTSRVWIGLRGVAVENFWAQEIINPDSVEGSNVIEFDSFCDYADGGIQNYMDPEDCNSCYEASAGLVTAVLMAAFLTLPNIFTDVLRMFYHYDVNCQKFFGSVINFASFASSLYAYRGYADQCFKSFYEGDVSAVSFIDTTNAALLQQVVEAIQEKDPEFSFDEDNPTVDIKVSWTFGNGLVLIILATFLKLIDIIAMLLVPTPEITREKSLQEEYEALYGEDEGGNDESSPQETEAVKKEAGA